MTEQEKYGMEQLAEYLDMRIRNEEKNIKENRDKLDRDYLYHFAWNGEELFKSHFMVKQYGELRQVIRVAEAPGEVHGYIQHKREECLKELVSGSIRRRQGLCWLRTASVHEGSPEGDKNEEGP